MITPMLSFDVGIIGAGTMGSAAAYHLSRRGFRVVAFEQFGIAHEFGSHSGETRIIRYAYHESPDYVPLVKRASELWSELESLCGSTLLVPTGGIDLGPPEGTMVRNAILACISHQMPYERLEATEVQKRWPQFRVPENWIGCYDPNMGFLLVEPCIRESVNAAKKNGAVIRQSERVTSWKNIDGRIEIRTDQQVYVVERLLLCAGSWTYPLLNELNLPLAVKRRTLAWFRVSNPEEFSIGKFPIFLFEKPNGLLYGFPVYNRPAVKIANHHSLGPTIDPDQVDRNFGEKEADELRAFTREHLPSVSSDLAQGKVCLYTLTPDEDFIIDFHPEHRNVLIAAGFSGHGFKFAPVVGEILADLCEKGTTMHPIHRFRLSRFV